MLRVAAMLLICMLNVGAWAQDKEEAARKELIRLQGEWKLINGQSAGQALPAAVIANFSMYIKDNQYEFRNSEETEKGAMLLDPTKKPAQIDINISEGSFKGQKQIGIYEITGNKVKFCVTVPDDTRRPEKFESTEANKCMIFEFEQVKK